MTTVIYHDRCTDGFAAAWAVHDTGRSIDCYLPGIYQHDPPDLTGQDLIIVDFSYKRPVMERIIEQCRSLIILDHHQSAVDDLTDLLSHPKVSGRLDTGRSGSMLAWEWFHPDDPPPQLLRHIQDRDLWVFRLDNTREIVAGLRAHPMTFDCWGAYMKMGRKSLWATLGMEGAAILRNECQVLDAMEPNHRIIGGIPFINAPPHLASELGHRLAIGRPFAVVYWDSADGRQFSLRSATDGVDVAAIAQRFGGGGHRHAAGFRLPFDAAWDDLITVARNP